MATLHIKDIPSKSNSHKEFEVWIVTRSPWQPKKLGKANSRKGICRLIKDWNSSAELAPETSWYDEFYEINLSETRKMYSCLYLSPKNSGFHLGELVLQEE